MAPTVGFEPTTDRLTADCSTTELRWNNFKYSNAARRKEYQCGGVLLSRG